MPVIDIRVHGGAFGGGKYRKGSIIPEANISRGWTPLKTFLATLASSVYRMWVYNERYEDTNMENNNVILHLNNNTIVEMSIANGQIVRVVDLNGRITGTVTCSQAYLRRNNGIADSAGQNKVFIATRSGTTNYCYVVDLVANTVTLISALNNQSYPINFISTGVASNGHAYAWFSYHDINVSLSDTVTALQYNVNTGLVNTIPLLMWFTSTYYGTTYIGSGAYVKIWSCNAGSVAYCYRWYNNQYYACARWYDCYNAKWATNLAGYEAYTLGTILAYHVGVAYTNFDQGVRLHYDSNRVRENYYFVITTTNTFIWGSGHYVYYDFPMFTEHPSYRGRDLRPYVSGGNIFVEAKEAYSTGSVINYVYESKLIPDKNVDAFVFFTNMASSKPYFNNSNFTEYFRKGLYSVGLNLYKVTGAVGKEILA